MGNLDSLDKKPCLATFTSKGDGKMTAFDRVGDGYRKLSWSGGSKSTAINIEGASVCSLYVPDTFTATSMTFECQEPDGTFLPVHYKGALLAIDITPGARNILPVEIFAVVGGMIKVVLDTNETGEGRFYLVK